MTANAITATDTQITITVYGIPGPQGSKSAKGRARDGHTILVESSKKVKPWRESVKAAALAVLLPTKQAPLICPVIADMVFTFARPDGHFGTGRNAGMLKPSAPLYPAVYPDLSKLVRSTEDALSKIAYSDDARIVAYGRLAKVYACSDDPDALHIPGAVIRIRPAVTA